MKNEDFIAKAKAIHGEKYDYSKVEYVNSFTKVCIICPEHGEFWQLPFNHLNQSHAQGCPKCAAKSRWDKRGKPTTEDFIRKAKEVHGSKYDYSKVEYVNAATKVCIICPIHGEFWQTPANHLMGNGCSKCAGRNITTEDFIEKARKVHGDKYDYSKVEYKASKGKICIICPEHGEFWQMAQSHLANHGCPKCSFDKAKMQFIARAKKAYGGKYDYSKVEYSNNKN